MIYIEFIIHNTKCKNIFLHNIHVVSKQQNLVQLQLQFEPLKTSNDKKISFVSSEYFQFFLIFISIVGDNNDDG